jgi:hypothetical protein
MRTKHLLRSTSILFYTVSFFLPRFAIAPRENCTSPHQSKSLAFAGGGHDVAMLRFLGSILLLSVCFMILDGSLVQNGSHP